MGSGSAPASRGSLAPVFPYVAIGGVWTISVHKKAEKLFAAVVRAPQNATLVKAEWRH